MKKVLFCILMMLLPILANADPVEIEGVWYNLIPKGNVAEVTSNPSGDKYSGDVTILDKFTYDGVEYSVTKIVENAFYQCINITSIIIGNNVTSIGARSFYGCSDLRSITIGSSVKSIEAEAFYGCKNLASLYGSDIEAWCEIAFNGEYTNPLFFAHHLYLNGEEIKDLVIPNSVESLGNYAFLGCSGLTSVTIPNSVTSIGASAFSGCSGLTSVTIPNSVTSIGTNAFSICSGLTSVTIPNSVTSIGEYAFYSCSNLTSVHISDFKAWCKIIFSGLCFFTPYHLYLNGEEIKDLIIPSNISSIGNFAFSGCSGLTSVTIGNNVESIGEVAFYGCSSLTSVTIGNNVTSIGNGAFWDCSGLTSVTIGNSVESIGSEAFWKCKLLSDVYCLPEKVRQSTSGGEGLYTYPDAFSDSYQEFVTLHVPAASIDAYKAIEPWKSFKEIVELNGEDIPEIPATPKCATPTISLVDGKITFSCETEGVTYISNVSVNDAKDYYDNEISAPKKFKVSVYATKVNYDNSDTATAEFDFFGDTSRSGDVDGNGIVNVADHVKLSDIIMNQNK